jgi:NAD(P)H-dependent flavin oxidoreductase YrpB (nitropropane dioxygenase family)
MQTRVTELLGIRYPVIQGGLAYLAYSDLAAAVSNAGGLGQITAMTLSSPEELREEIQKVKKMTKNPFGVNFAIGQHGRSYEDMLEVAIEEQVPAISITGGNPAPILERLANEPIRTMVLVAGVRQAVKAEQLGADMVMVVGQEGGGHLGRDDIGTMVLVPRVVESVSIPVIASGGIGNGNGFLAALALGAEGIEMGTRFIATRECVHASEKYKQDILEAKETDTVVIKRTLGAPGRTLKTELALKIIEEERKGANYEQLKDMISGKSNMKYIYEGNPVEGYGWAGQVVGLIHDIPTVQELFDNMIREAENGLQRLNQFILQK